jgi:putative peptidoglycan lipid II flippase
MIPVSITRVFAQSFYAVKEMKVPVKGAFVSLVVNVFASWLLAFPLGLEQGGLALATAVSSAVNMFYLSEMYRKKNGVNPFKGLYKPLFLIAVASLGMGALVWLGDAGFTAVAGERSGFSMRLLEILLVIPLGVAGYIGFAKLLGLKDLSELTGRLRGS